MALGFFKKSNKDVPEVPKKNCLDIPEDMYDAPFSAIIACMDPKYLENAIASNFDKILPHRTSNELRYFKIYPDLYKLFLEKFDDVKYFFADNGSYADFKTIIEIFPELAPEIYEFLLQEFLDKDIISSSIVNSLNIADDILIPMSDIERYQDQVYHHHFDIVRENIIEILYMVDYYDELWDVIQVFEQYFDIPRKYFDDFVNEQIKEEIDSTFKVHNFMPTYDNELCDYEESDMLYDIFMDSQAYNLIMNELPSIMAKSGLGMYQVFANVLGRNKELEKAHDFCPELISDEQFPIVVGDEVVITCYTDDNLRKTSFIGKIIGKKQREVRIISKK